jgi:hypothetical protein
MSKADDGARLLRFILSDGPLPAQTGRTAWVQNGMAARNERLLTASLRKAGITPEHAGYPGTRQSWWWSLLGDSRPIGAQVRVHECTACRRVLNLPESRLCISTPRCPGTYVPTTYSPQPTPPSHCDSFTSIDLSQWKSSPSPLRNRAVTRRNTLNRASSWPCVLARLCIGGQATCTSRPDTAALRRPPCSLNYAA